MSNEKSEENIKIEEDDLKEVIETMKDKGSALEKNVEFIFQSAGFETQRNTRLAKYEIDVLAKIGNRNIVIECKNYQSSTIVIRNLIHQWSSKNQIIKANKIILVLAGVKIKKSDRDLANKFDIELWEENDLTELFKLSLKPSELREKLLKKISLKPTTISELYRDEISKIVIRPILGSFGEDIEETYEKLNNWLRIFIRTKLQIEGTTKEERIKHIELFEGTKEKGAFFNIFKVKRAESEYWDNLKESLNKEKILSKKAQKEYYEMMEELMEEYEAQKEYYEEEEQEDRIRKIISSRLYDAIISNDSVCEFGFNNKQIVKVHPQNEGKFLISIDGIDQKQANLVNWILTSEFSPRAKLKEDEMEIIEYSWFCSSLEETSEKAYRLLDEFFGFDERDELRDFIL